MSFLKRAIVTGVVIGISLSGCGPNLPDDLPTLIQLMNRNSETISVDATLKVSRLYGNAGLLRALRDGLPTARARAAFRLRDFKDGETEQALLDVVVRDPDAFVRVQALTSLQEVGTARAIPVLQTATMDRDPDVARNARSAKGAIGDRATSRRR